MTREKSLICKAFSFSFRFCHKICHNSVDTIGTNRKNFTKRKSILCITAADHQISGCNIKPMSLLTHRDII